MGEVYAQYISSLYSLVVRMKNKMDIQSSVDEMCEDLKKVCSYPPECHSFGVVVWFLTTI